MTLRTRLQRVEREQQRRLEAYLDALTPAQWLTLLKTDATQAIEQKGLAAVVDALDAQGMHPEWVAFFTDGSMDADTLQEMADRCALPEGEECPCTWPRLSQGDLALP